MSFDKKTFESLFREYYPYLTSFARKYVDDIDDCKDIVHNVFVNLWNRKDTLHTETTLKSYLFTAVQNRCLNYIRDRKKIVNYQLPQEQEQIHDYLDSTDYLEQAELEAKIKKAIDDLPEKSREIFILNRFEGKKYAEIANLKGVSVKAIEAQMSKSLKLLRKALSEYLPAIVSFFVKILGSIALFVCITKWP